MDEYKTYFDLGVWIVPILVVFLTAGLAFWQLRYQNRQERINKWKDEFRNYSAEYIEFVSLFTINIHEGWNNEFSREKIQKLKLQNVEFRGISTKLELLMDENNPSYRELMDCISRQGQWFLNSLGKEPETFSSEAITDFHVLAKKIHQKYKG